MVATRSQQPPRPSWTVALVGALWAAAAALPPAPASGQEPPVGLEPVALGPGPFTFDTAEQHRVRVVVVARGLNHPFSVALLPDGDALVSERGRGLRLVRGATGPSPRLDPAPVEGAPAPASSRGGGLHDVGVHPDFARTRLVYLTYNRAGPAGADGAPQSAVTLVRGRFEGGRLTGVEEILVGEWRDGASGSRVAFGGGYVYVTTGAPFGGQAQEVGSVYGKVLRLHEDGRVPPDNPFTGREGARPEVYSLGHRDQLGLAVHPDGTVLAAEHGPNGGDEVNLILPGRNYGWPTFSFGRNYDGPRVSEQPLGPGIEQPLVVWLPSIAPTGLAVYTGTRFPGWTGNVFVGSARRGQIPGTGGLERIVVNERKEELRRERMLEELHQRIRDVRQGPDGLIYLLTDEDDGALLRLEPAP